MHIGSFAALVGCMVLVGCNSSSGDGSSGANGGAGGSSAAGQGSGGSGGSGGAPVGCDEGGADHASCDACQGAATAPGGCCATLASTCSGNEACVGLNDCIAACADDACVAACPGQFAAGEGDFDALIACVLGAGTPEEPGACALACTASAGSCDDGGSDHPNCDTCRNVEFAAGGCCEVPAGACTANAECVALDECLFACADDACLEGCVETHPDGAGDLTALLDCAYGDGQARGACGTACGVPTCDDGGAEFLSCNDCQAAEAAAGGCCQAPADVCYANQACADLLECLNACADTDCQNACVASHPDGTTDMSAVMNCLFGDADVVGACSTACQ